MACWKVRTEEAGGPRWLAEDTAEEEASPSAAAGAEERGRRGRRRWRWQWRWRGEKRAGLGGGKAAEGVSSAWGRQAAMGEGGGAMVME